MKENFWFWIFESTSTQYLIPYLDVNFKTLKQKERTRQLESGLDLEFEESAKNEQKEIVQPLRFFRFF